MASEKDKFEMEKRSEDHLNYQTSAHSAQWQIGDPSVSTCQGPSASLVNSFNPGLWNHPTNAQSFGFGVANANASATGSGIGKPVPVIPRLDMGGVLLPVGPNVLPPSLSHFQADSGFIERAARFSCFNGGSYTGMMNPSANSESLSAYSNTPKGSPRDSSIGVVSCENVMENQRDKDSLGLSNNESDEPINLGSASGDSSSRDLSNKRKKRTIQDMELVPVEGTSQSPTEAVTNNANGKQKAERNISMMATARSSGKQPKDSSEAPKEDYIHMRARRGQATNSHSLAERVRREKISERMKYLQDLVPGCSKVTGKAVMLDEIINYVQSLQRQVEFLSMKLATVNPRLDFNIEGLLAKDFLQPRDGSSSTMGFSHDMINPHSLLAQPGLVPPGMSSMPYPSDALRRALSAQLTMMSAYKEPTPQMPNAWDDEIQNVYQMNFGTTNPPLNSQELSDTPRDGYSN